MTIVSSTIIEDARQADGRRYIRERHVDQYGIGHVRLLTLVAADYDAVAMLATHASELDAALTNAEISDNISTISTLGSLADPTLRYSSKAQNVAALREAYRGMTREEAVMTGDFLSTLTDAQLMNAFNLTQDQVTSLRANRLTPAAQTAAEIRAAAGA